MDEPQRTGESGQRSAAGTLSAHPLGTGQDLAAISTQDLGGVLLARLQQPRTLWHTYDDQAYLAMLIALRDAIEPLLESKANRLSATLLGDQFAFIEHCWRFRGLPLQGAAFLEIGSGSVNPLGRMFTHLMAGARRAWCLDLDAPSEPEAAVRALARIAAETLVDPARVFGRFPIDAAKILANLAGFDLAKLRRGDTAGVDGSRLEFLIRSAADTGLDDGAVDVVVSNSVLEHLPDVGAALAELSRITRPGGFGIHGIDVCDHRSYLEVDMHPLEFLTVESEEPIVHCSNRLRLGDHETLFARHGFRICERMTARKVDVPPSLRSRLARPWARMSDEQLDTLWGQYMVQKV